MSLLDAFSVPCCELRPETPEAKQKRKDPQPTRCFVGSLAGSYGS